MELKGREDESVILLDLIPLSRLPRLVRAEVLLPGPPPGEEKFKRYISKQNPGLRTERRVLRHHQEMTNGQLLVFSIDCDSAEVLAATGDQAHFGLSRVTLRVARGLAHSGAGPE